MWAVNFLAELAKINKQSKQKGAMVVGLHGDLGSGKTTFTQAVARGLGISERVTSPTFVIMKTYEWQGLPLPKSKGNPQKFFFSFFKRIDDPEKITNQEKTASEG